MKDDFYYRPYFFYSLPESQWREHWTNGGTGVTKTSGETTSKISKSVELFGDPEIYMVGSELHSSRKRFDLSDFWEFHRERTGEK